MVSGVTYQRHDMYPPTPSMCPMANARSPENAPASIDAEKNRDTRHCTSCRL